MGAGCLPVEGYYCVAGYWSLRGGRHPARFPHWPRSAPSSQKLWIPARWHLSSDLKKGWKKNLSEIERCLLSVENTAFWVLTLVIHATQALYLINKEK